VNPVVIEPIAGNAFRVTGAGGLSMGLTAEGATADEAIDRLREQIQVRMNAGARVADLNVTPEAPAWVADAGCLRDEPLFEAWVEEMKENRRRLNEDPEAL
jgi:hypothetical protein